MRNVPAAEQERADSTAVRLSAEELLFVVTQQARPTVAAELVARLRHAGLRQTSLESRVDAAQHSLLARGLLDDRRDTLAEPLLHAARGLVDATCSLSYRESGAAIVYYFGERGTFEQQVDRGIVHTIREVTGQASLVATGVSFFGIAGSRPVETAEVEVAVAVFDEIKRRREPTDLERRLADAGVPDPVLAEFVQDLSPRPPARVRSPALCTTVVVGRDRTVPCWS
jgi:hypothetical protein